MRVGRFDVPCGCEGRKEIMSEGNWQVSAAVVVAIVVACVVAYKVSK